MIELAANAAAVEGLHDHLDLGMAGQGARYGGRAATVEAVEDQIVGSCAHTRIS